MNEMNQLPLAIATVPMQRFEKLYPLEKALQRGPVSGAGPAVLPVGRRRTPCVRMCAAIWKP